MKLQKKDCSYHHGSKSVFELSTVGQQTCDGRNDWLLNCKKVGHESRILLQCQMDNFDRSKTDHGPWQF
jgi:hypothetical protein